MALLGLGVVLDFLYVNPPIVLDGYGLLIRR